MKKPIVVEDVFAIPDYVALLAPCMDPNFGNYAKGDATQLQFTFTSVDVCSKFPSGCAITYRAYSGDTAYEFRFGSTTNNSLTPSFSCEPRHVNVVTQPPDDKDGKAAGKS